MKRWTRAAVGILTGIVLAASLGACGGQPQSPVPTEPEATQKDASAETDEAQVENTSDESPEAAADEGDVVVAPDGTTAPPGTVIEDDFAPDSLPLSEGDYVTLEGTLAYETFEHKGTVECLILVLDAPFDAVFGTYPNENDPVLHEGVTCVDISPLLYDGSLDASAAGMHVRVAGTFWGSSKMNGAHYDESGTFQINGGCALHEPVLLD